MNPNRRSRSRRRARKRQKPLHRRAAYQQRRITLIPEGDIIQVPRAAQGMGRAFEGATQVARVFSAAVEPLSVESAADVNFIAISLVDPQGDTSIPLIGETGDDYWQRQRVAGASAP